MYHRADDHLLQNHIKFKANQHAVKGVAPAEPLLFLRTVVGRGNNFARPFCIAKADIAGAFDNVKQSCVNKAMINKGIPKAVRMAPMRINMNEFCQLRLQRVRTRPVKRHCGIRQGGPSSMRQFAWAFDECVSDVIPSRNDKQWGFQYGWRDGVS
jgi:hypothetical protein